MSNTDFDDRRQVLDQFASALKNDGAGAQMPAIYQQAPAPAERSFGALRVAVHRDEAVVIKKLETLAAAAGQEWFYRFPVRNKGGGTDYIEGPSIKLANDLARIYGNCEVDVRAFDMGDSWLLYARFTDFETGFSLTRPFQQRKNQKSLKGDNDRQLDIAFQIGASKAIRNVVVNALQTFADIAFDAARNSIVERIKGNLDKYRDRVLQAFANENIDVARAERAIMKARKDWLAPDIAKLIAMMKAVSDSMATWDETFPPLEVADAAAAEREKEAEAAKPKPPQETKPAASRKSGLDDFAGSGQRDAEKQAEMEKAKADLAKQHGADPDTGEVKDDEDEKRLAAAKNAVAEREAATRKEEAAKARAAAKAEKEAQAKAEAEAQAAADRQAEADAAAARDRDERDAADAEEAAAREEAAQPTTKRGAALAAMTPAPAEDDDDAPPKAKPAIVAPQLPEGMPEDAYKRFVIMGRTAAMGDEPRWKCVPKQYINDPDIPDIIRYGYDKETARRAAQT